MIWYKMSQYTMDKYIQVFSDISVYVCFYGIFLRSFQGLYLRPLELKMTNVKRYWPKEESRQAYEYMYTYVWFSKYI